MKLRFFAIVLCLVPAMCLAQVKSTTVKGKVTDAATGEALPFVQVYFEGTQIGTTPISMATINSRTTRVTGLSYSK